MAEKTPFTPASIYRGKNLADSVKAAGYSSVPEFSVTLREKGLPNIGQTGGQESLELLNKQIRSKPNYNPDDIYLAVQDDVKKIQTEVLGTTAQTKGNRGIRQQITNTLDDIQKSFLTVAGKVKLKGQERIQAIADEIVQKIPKVTPATAFKAATNIFKSLVIGGPLTGADVMSRQANEEAMQTLFPTQQTFAGGGIASMDDMIRPLGYAHGGMHYEHGGFHKEEGKTFGQGEFHYDDPNLIRFIKKRADQNETTYQEELMKFVDEVEGFYRNKKNEVGKD